MHETWTFGPPKSQPGHFTNFCGGSEELMMTMGRSGSTSFNSPSFWKDLASTSKPCLKSLTHASRWRKEALDFGPHHLASTGASR